MGDRLIGSADIRSDRDARRLVVQKLLFEEGFGITAEVQRSIDELEAFVRRDGGAQAG